MDGAQIMVISKINQMQCRKCKKVLDKENTVEIFAYNQWSICDKCEIIFFKMVDDFFNSEIGDSNGI